MWLASCGDADRPASYWWFVCGTVLRTEAERAVPAGLSSTGRSICGPQRVRQSSSITRPAFFRVHPAQDQSGDHRETELGTEKRCANLCKLGRHHPFQREHRTVRRTGGSRRHEPASEKLCSTSCVAWHALECCVEVCKWSEVRRQLIHASVCWTSGGAPKVVVDPTAERRI